jgi:aspartate/methionine/tyrosine aminotransferase
VIVTSGLSKAYGIPGVRIGWIVGPEEVVYDCWTQHDSLTICPNKLSDAIARIAVQPDHREKLYRRGRNLLQGNLEILQDWVGRLGDGFRFSPPEAGAICFIEYPGGIGSAELCERIRRNQSTLIVPGAYLGMEGFIRIWMGGKPDFLKEGLRRAEVELRAL